MIEEFGRKTIEAEKPWNLFEAMEIMGVDPRWFADERSIELLKLYLFHKPNQANAFPGPLRDQPSIWVDAKLLYDAAFIERGMTDGLD